MSTWEIVETADEWEPVYDRPACPGPATHEWTLSIEEGEVGLHSGCQECDVTVEQEYLCMDGSLKGRLVFTPEHPNLGGWHGLTRCDCGWWWTFEPSVLVASSSSENPQ